MKVVITDAGFANVDAERMIAESAGHELILLECKTAEDVINQAADADALIVQWAPINSTVIEALSNCQVIVRYGIGVDNVDLEAATLKGIDVCNIPDYCINEVANHSMAMALSLHRQLPQTQKRFLKKEWNIMPPDTIFAADEKTFATAGFGRIAREVHKRAAVFGFRLIASDPNVPAPFMEELGVEKVELSELVDQADIMSLHMPLIEETKHFINKDSLNMMRPGAIIINTSRGGLIDIDALSEALNSNRIGGAGLDVYDPEPADTNHPIFKSDRLIATSHTAWNSASSIPKLQQLAAEEVVRVLAGELPSNQVN